MCFCERYPEKNVNFVIFRQNTSWQNKKQVLYCSPVIWSRYGYTGKQMPSRVSCRRSNTLRCHVLTRTVCLGLSGEAHDQRVLWVPKVQSGGAVVPPPNLSGKRTEQLLFFSRQQPGIRKIFIRIVLNGSVFCFFCTFLHKFTAYEKNISEHVWKEGLKIWI